MKTHRTIFAWVIAMPVVVHPVSTAANDEHPLTLAPASSWVLDYGNEYCALLRTFGEGEQRVQMQLVTYGSGVSYRLELLSELLPDTNVPQDQVGFRFGNVPEFTEMPVLRGEANDLPFASMTISFLGPETYARREDLAEEAWREAWPPEPAFEAAVQELHFNFRNRAISLQTGAMNGPLDALRECRADLLGHWGFDAELLDSLSEQTRPKDSTLRWMIRHYPSRALRAGQSAIVPVRAIIDESGDVEDCTVQAPTPDDDFNRFVCNGLERGFEPARDASGNPVRAIYTTHVLYVMG